MFNFVKKIHSVFIKFLCACTEDQFRDDIFLVLLKRIPKGHTEMVSFYWQTWEEVTLKRKLWSFEKFWFYWSWCSKLSGKKKKKNARNSPKLARQIAMPSCRPPLLASWIKKEFLCGSFYAQVMLESVWTKEDEFLCFTRLKLFECSTKKLTGMTILLLCTWRKRGENNSKMFQKIFA